MKVLLRHLLRLGLVSKFLIALQFRLFLGEVFAFWSLALTTSPALLLNFLVILEVFLEFS